jgi:putative redox protein
MTTQALWRLSSNSTSCSVDFGSTNTEVDIDAAAGGSDALPHPHDLLDGALAACTTLTLQLYAKHKKFDIQDIRTTVSHTTEGGFKMKRTVHITGTLTDEIKASLLRIANNCPIHKTLTGEIAIDTTVEGGIH